jgi:hypothetical protein
MKLILPAALLGIGVAAGDWMASAAAAVLLIVWLLLRPVQGPPVLFFALAFQWLQVTIGLFYTAFTGRTLEGSTAAEYRLMVLLGLGCVLTLAVGLHFGIRFVRGRHPGRPIDTEVFSLYTLVALYVGSIAVAGVVQQLAWDYPIFRQPIVVANYIRLGILFLLFRRLVRPAPDLMRIGLLLSVEVALGLTGFFANFREAFVLAAIAMSEAFNPRRIGHWFGLTAVTLLLVGLATLWMGVRTDFRQDFYTDEMFAESRSRRMERMNTLARAWMNRDRQELLWDLDFLIDRVWAVYYPALALARVPSQLPHTHGDLILVALRHILQPRVLFPNKPYPPSESSYVRRFSGVWVAGEEVDTSIAFGYAGEAYVDFGIPGMFVPVLLWGLFLGIAFQYLFVFIRHRELAIPLTTVIFWLSVYLFERSWLKWMGLTGTMLIYLGAATYLLDRWLCQRYVIRGSERQSAVPGAASPQPGEETLMGSARPR